VDNTLLDLQNSSYPTQPHSIIANYTMPYKYGKRTREFWGGGAFLFAFQSSFPQFEGFLIK